MYPMKLSPALKDNLWGGTRLKTEYKIETELAVVAEAWVFSGHKDGSSTVVNGEYAGLTLPETVEKLGPSCLGTNGKIFDFFPILIKLIDAKDDLSIQVHPSDEYALRVEGEYGKTEMWYVVDCDPGAYLYYGFNRTINKEEFSLRIADNTLTDVLNKVEVKKGDCLFIPSGTIHAIGGGILIAEIQQNSNTTYRVSDYGRRGPDGKLRELHVDKAIDVTDLNPPAESYGQVGMAEGKARLVSCEYFTVDKLMVTTETTVCAGKESFAALLLLDGDLTVGNSDTVCMKPGDCVFLPAGLGDVKITGTGALIVSRV